jgi:Helicase HerA, central domain
VFARAGFGKSNLIKLLFANLYGSTETPTVEKRKGRKVPVGTVVFDPDGEYFWPDDKDRPGLCDVDALADRLVVFTDQSAPSAFYQSFVVDHVHLDIRELPAAKVVGLVLSAEQQDQQNVQKLKALTPDRWRHLVDAVYEDKQAADETLIRELLGLKPSQEMELYAARANMVRIVNALHDPSSRLLSSLKTALSEGKLCVVDISRMRGSQGLALAGVLLQEIFDHNQRAFTAAEPDTIPTIAVIEEAQSVLGGASAHAEGPFVAWVKEGRKYDLGAVLVTQQPGSISAELLSQGDNWFIFHLLSAGDLRALKNANAHFSDDLLSSLLNEPLVGHGVFWSSVAGKSYPIPIRTFSFEDSHETSDPSYDAPPLDCYASQLRNRFAESMRRTVERAGGMRLVGTHSDPLETIKAAAIAGLATDARFISNIQAGLKWGRVQHLLADHIDDGLVPSPKSQWVYDQKLVVRALNELMGNEGDGWVAERRENISWVRGLRPVSPPPSGATANLFEAPDDRG